MPIPHLKVWLLNKIMSPHQRFYYSIEKDITPHLRAMW